MTTPTRRSLAAASAALLLLLTAGCGVDGSDAAGGDEGATETTAAPADDGTDTTVADETDDTEVDQPDDTATDETIEDEPDDTVVDETLPDVTVDDEFDPSDLPDETRQQILDIYTGMGLSEDQASCLLDALYEQGAGEMDPNDISAMMDLLGQCDISITDFSGGDFGG